MITLHRALRLHGDDGSLEHAQQCLLHALPADVAHAVGAARAGLARDLVDFVDEDDALSGWGVSQLVNVHRHSGKQAHSARSGFQFAACSWGEGYEWEGKTAG